MAIKSRPRIRMRLESERSPSGTTEHFYLVASNVGESVAKGATFSIRAVPPLSETDYVSRILAQTLSVRRDIAPGEDALQVRWHSRRRTAPLGSWSPYTGVTGEAVITATYEGEGGESYTDEQSLSVT